MLNQMFVQLKTDHCTNDTHSLICFWFYLFSSHSRTRGGSWCQKTIKLDCRRVLGIRTGGLEVCRECRNAGGSHADDARSSGMGTPSTLETRIRKIYPVSSAQVYNVWRELNETYWRRDELQIPSEIKLLKEFSNEADLFEPKDIPEGVEILLWGMKKIAEPLRGKILEVGMDATCTYASITENFKFDKLNQR